MTVSERLSEGYLSAIFHFKVPYLDVQKHDYIYNILTIRYLRKITKKIAKLRASGWLVKKIAKIRSLFCQFNEQKNRLLTQLSLQGLLIEKVKQSPNPLEGKYPSLNLEKGGGKANYVLGVIVDDACHLVVYTEFMNRVNKMNKIQILDSDVSMTEAVE